MNLATLKLTITPRNVSYSLTATGQAPFSGPLNLSTLNTTNDNEKSGFHHRNSTKQSFLSPETKKEEYIYTYPYNWWPGKS
jgi:hypothetical protein